MMMSDPGGCFNGRMCVLGCLEYHWPTIKHWGSSEMQEEAMEAKLTLLLELKSWLHHGILLEK